MLKPTPQPAAQHAPVTSSDVQPYYHFADSQSGAFVIIAGSDLMPAVIGYGDHWTYEADAPLPPNMQSWLAQVEEAEQYLESHPEAARLQKQALAQNATCEPITPIMTCHWGQTSPYNSLCPRSNDRQTVVGCMATALCQVFYTQKYPTQSYGKMSYKNLGVPMSLSYDGLTYDYDLMLDTYKGVEYTDEQKDEVAKLCYYVGTACKMQYGQASATIELESIDGMRRHFGLTEAALLYRHYYSLKEWNQVLQTQLREGLPIVYTGQSSAGGHAFVIDGLDEQGFYHVNWGWDGMADGYYDITILHTDMVGTGASANEGFNIENQALMNLCDPAKVRRWYCPLATYRAWDVMDYDYIGCSYQGTLQRGTELNFECTVVNYSFMPVMGNIGVKVMKEGHTYDLCITDEVADVDPSFGMVDFNGKFTWWPTDAELQCSYTIPDDIEDGKYLLYLVVQPEGQTLVDAVRQYNDSPSYWTLIVRGNQLQLNHLRHPADETGIEAIEADSWATDLQGTRGYDMMGRRMMLPTGTTHRQGLYIVNREKRISK